MRGGRLVFTPTGCEKAGTCRLFYSTAMKTLPIRHTRYYNESWILPISRKEMEERGWNQVDFVYVSGDAYVDHPSFGHAIITRL